MYKINQQKHSKRETIPIEFFTIATVLFQLYNNPWLVEPGGAFVTLGNLGKQMCMNL